MCNFYSISTNQAAIAALLRVISALSALAAAQWASQTPASSCRGFCFWRLLR
jgi:hypothetical protein